jgi:hypothetical protein
VHVKEVHAVLRLHPVEAQWNQLQNTAPPAPRATRAPATPRATRAAGSQVARAASASQLCASRCISAGGCSGSRLLRHRALRFYEEKAGWVCGGDDFEGGGCRGERQLREVRGGILDELHATGMGLQEQRLWEGVGGGGVRGGKAEG